MKKALMIASVASMIEQFNMNNILLLQSLGYSVDVACNFEQGSTIPSDKVTEFRQLLELKGIRTFQLPIPRSPKAVKAINKSYHLTKELINKNHYDIIHCHSPIGSVITRLAAKDARRYGTKVIYTAHGFHFYHGAPFVNWMIYYPVEKALSKYTDVIITINNEDYARAKKFELRNSCNVMLCNGVGVDSKFIDALQVDRVNKRKEFGINEDDIVLTSVGELSKRKNHSAILRALAKIKDKRIKYLICGKGAFEQELTRLIHKFQLEDQVILAGFRTDIYEIMKISDCFVFPSIQEGLPVALLEAMASGLPVICSDIRGNVDLIQNNKGGYLIKPNKIDTIIAAINQFCTCDKERLAFSEFNKSTVLKHDIVNINKIMYEIYKDAGSNSKKTSDFQNSSLSKELS